MGYMATLTVALAFASGLFSVAEGISCGQPGRLACFSSTLLLQSRAVQCAKADGSCGNLGTHNRARGVVLYMLV